jgi:hypothetical protein
MMDVTLHPTPRLRDVLVEQLRMVGLSLRPEALIVAAVLGVGTFLIGVEILKGGPGFDSRETFPTGLIAFFLPFAVWRGVQRFGPDFLWSLPVDRRQLALARVFAGWVWLMAAVSVFALWLLTLALVARAPIAPNLARIPFTSTAAAYLLGSAVVLGLRHPLRWLIGIAGLFFLFGGLNDLFGRTANGDGSSVAWSEAWRWAMHGPYGLRTVLSSSGFFVADDAGASPGTLPDLMEWAITTVIWFGGGLAALWAALLRHREQRRP